MTEYALILGLIVLVSIAGYTVFGQAVLNLFEAAKALMP
jgi:Flp pilus assembly pilin Flp